MEHSYKKHRRNTSFTWHQPDPPYQLVTEQQARLYREEGGFVLHNVFSREELDALLVDLDQAEAAANETARNLAANQPSISRADEIVFSAHVVARSKVAREFSKHPKLVALCQDLIGPAVRLYWDQLVYKRPGTPDEFPWHQDNGYTFIEPQQYLTCWIAMNDATIENGCPWIAPGVHKGGTLHHEWTPLGFKCLDGVSDAKALPVPAGSIAVFSSLTPHRTGPNTSEAVRKAYILQYAADGAVQRPRGSDDIVPCNEPGRQYRIC